MFVDHGLSPIEIATLISAWCATTIILEVPSGVLADRHSRKAIMVFGAVMPAFVGLANWMIPLMIGAPDMALPRMNNFSFWLLPMAFGLLVSTLFMEGGGPNFGWTFYAPLSTKYGPDSTDLFILSVHMMGISSIMGAINVVVTVFNMRAPGMTLMKMPLFVWTWLITAFLLIAVMPVLAGVVTMMLMDIHFGTSFFNAAGGGDPVMFQHIFWFFGHPEVYIMILPAFGAVSQIIPAFSRKPLFGYTSMVYATAAIAFLSFIVWAHHMYVSGMNPWFGFFFATTTLIIAVPTAIKVYNWTLTLWKGNIQFTLPMLFALAFIVTFVNGGITGLFLGNVVVDVPLSDTMFVVAHFHMVMGVAPILVVFGGIYHWYPLITGRMLHEGMGQFHFWVTFIGAYTIFLPLHYLGFLGVPRRYFEMGETNFIPESAQDLNAFVTVVALTVGMAQVVFFINLFWSLRNGKQAGSNPWKACSLEWRTAQVPPGHGNFDDLPVVYRWAYDYGVPGVDEDFIPQDLPPAQVSTGKGG